MTDTIYKGQSKLRIRLSCGIPISGALECSIKYRKPSGITGSWEAGISDGEKGIIEYIVRDNVTINESGSWTLWSYVVFSDGNSAPGEPYYLYVKEEGS